MAVEVAKHRWKFTLQVSVLLEFKWLQLILEVQKQSFYDRLSNTSTSKNLLLSMATEEDSMTEHILENKLHISLHTTQPTKCVQQAPKFP